MNEKKHIRFVYNPFSGVGRKALIPKWIDKLIDKDMFEVEICRVNHEGHAYELAREAAEKGMDIVCAIGGDGTVNGIASALRNTDTALAIIPCGSGNGLARHLHIPMDWKKAIMLINECNVQHMDYGVVNLKPFFCTCGVGFDAFISKKFSETRVRGPLAYVEKMLVNGLAFKPESYEIELRGVQVEFKESSKGVEGTNEGELHGVQGAGCRVQVQGTNESDIKTKAFLVSVANASQYGNNAYIAPQASVYDGMLDVTIIKPFLPTEAAQMAIQLFSGTIDRNSRIETFKCKSVSIHRKEAGVIHYDGDPVDTLADVEIAVVPKGLWCVCPKDEGVQDITQNIQSEIIDQFNVLSRNLKNTIQLWKRV